MKLQNNDKWIVETIVPEEVYTDREEFLEYFYNAAINAATRRTMSTVLLGQRRMGKTEIFKRVVNRLFFEQDHGDPNAVVPVYFSFPDWADAPGDFAKTYIENFMRHYVGFYTNRPELISDEVEIDELTAIIEDAMDLFPSSRTMDMLLKRHGAILTGDVVYPQQTAIETPRRMAAIDDSTIVMFLDEFQNTRLPQYEFEIAGLMQFAVESPKCPHFVTGSAMGILGREIIGRGSLFGRFRGKDIEALSLYYGAELAMKATRCYGANISEVMAPVIADRCGGNPFYITAVVQQAVERNTNILDEESLDKILAVDITSGFIWGELHEQVTRWIERVNEQGITKWILYLSALEENEEKEKKNRLNIERIQREIKKREGSDVSLEMIRDVLVKLSRGDLLEYLELGDWFRRVKDPILLSFLKVWGRIEVEGLNQGKVREDLAEEHHSYKKRVSEYKGYLAEVHMSQVLLNGQNQTLPGAFFNSAEDVQMPFCFLYVSHRFRFSAGKGREIDVYGAGDSEKWVCQSKWLTGDKVGVKILRDLMAQREIVNKEKHPIPVRMWLFSNEGLTPQAKAFAAEHGVLWSAREEFDALLQHMGLRKLPGI